MEAQKRIRVNWKIEGVEKTFLEACIEEVVQNGRDGASLKAKSWKNVAEKLKTEHSFFVDQKQMKNRYDYLKSKFSAWSKLKNKTGNVYDPITNNFNLSEEELQLEIKSNKFVEHLRRAPHNERFRMVKRRFQHSTETIHRCFHEVLNAMMEFAKEVIVPTSSTPIANASERHRRLQQIFPGAIGALDGTLVHAVVPIDQQNRYRGRGKGECYQNVLGICNFDMIFTFVWAGWEGIAHDSRVLKEVAFNPTSGFHFPPPDKYYLCDAAYTNTRGFMTPYRNTRYWLADFRRQRPLTKEEKFNHAHAKMRNVIERSYGVLKARFPILKQMAPFSFEIQRDIVIACFAIHNFIRKWNIHDQLFMEFDENTFFTETHDEENDGQSVHDMEWGSQSVDFMGTLREEIATQLMTNA